MKLLGTLTSPYVRKARLILLEKNIPHEFVLDVAGAPDRLLSRINPLGRIPALLLDDGFCVFDSSVIADYVDTLNDQPILIPRDDVPARLRVKRWEALADGIMDSALIVRNERARPVEKQDTVTLDLHNQAISDALEYVAQLLGEHVWCEGLSLTLADLALVSALIYLDLRQAERDWRGKHGNLAAWFERISERPGVIEANRA